MIGPDQEIKGEPGTRHYEDRMKEGFQVAYYCRTAPTDAALAQRILISLDTSALNDTQHDHDDRDDQ